MVLYYREQSLYFDSIGNLLVDESPMEITGLQNDSSTLLNADAVLPNNLPIEMWNADFSLSRQTAEPPSDTEIADSGIQISLPTMKRQ